MISTIKFMSFVLNGLFFVWISIFIGYILLLTGESLLQKRDEKRIKKMIYHVMQQNQDAPYGTIFTPTGIKASRSCTAHQTLAIELWKNTKPEIDAALWTHIRNFYGNASYSLRLHHKTIILKVEENDCNLLLLPVNN